MSIHKVHKVEILELKIKAIDRELRNIDTFGLDQKILFKLESEGVHIEKRKCYYRPPQEPALISFWNKIREISFTQDEALSMVSVLTGARQSIRKNPMFGISPYGEKLPFNESVAKDWLRHLTLLNNTSDNPIILSSKLFYNVIWEHPFTDGNGRFARSLIYGALAKYGWLSKPCLGLNGICDLHREAISKAFERTHVTGEFSHLENAIVNMIGASVTYVEKIIF